MSAPTNLSDLSIKLTLNGAAAGRPKPSEVSLWLCLSWVHRAVHVTSNQPANQPTYQRTSSSHWRHGLVPPQQGPQLCPSDHSSQPANKPVNQSNPGTHLEWWWGWSSSATGSLAWFCLSWVHMVVRVSSNQPIKQSINQPTNQFLNPTHLEW